MTDTLKIKVHYRVGPNGHYQMLHRASKNTTAVLTTWLRPEREVVSKKDAMLHLIDWEFKNDDGSPVECTWHNKMCLKVDVAQWLLQEFYAKIDDPTTPL